jgi:pyrophosphatase PpaX
MVVVFDVDGTLLDTYPIVRQTYIDVLSHHVPPIPYNETLLQSFFGPPLYDTFLGLVHDEEEARELVNLYRQQNKLNNPQYLKVFPEATHFIETLHAQGVKLGILSNKIKDAIFEGFALVGFPNVFDIIIGYEDVRHPKPHPEGLLHIRELFQEDLIMVGDSIYDMEVARRAGALAIGVTWGNTSRNDLMASGATKVVETFTELMEAIHLLSSAH